MNLRKIRKQIHYHSSQRWGVTVVLFIIISVITLSQYSAWNHVNEKYNEEEHMTILTSLKTKAAERTETKKKKYTRKNSLKPHKFDPNTISQGELIDMGIKESTAKSWTKYTSKGGKFYKTEDLKKLYAMNDYLYDKLKSFVEIKQLKRESYSKSTPYKKKKSWVKNDSLYKKRGRNVSQKPIKDTISDIERKEYNSKFKADRKTRSSGVSNDYIITLNTTDSTELQMLDGIGPVLSSRIIKYRDQLGGFHNMNQLLEVYGVKATLVSDIMNKINFDGMLRKINLNRITLDSLVRHPYFDYPTANIFINYRSHHGPFKDIDDVKKIIAIKQNWLDEVAPYFSYSIDE